MKVELTESVSADLGKVLKCYEDQGALGQGRRLTAGILKNPKGRPGTRIRAGSFRNLECHF
jgi:hypothetical protein